MKMSEIEKRFKLEDPFKPDKAINGPFNWALGYRTEGMHQSTKKIDYGYKFAGVKLSSERILTSKTE